MILEKKSPFSIFYGIIFIKKVADQSFNLTEFMNF